jgi:hypothetical protein
VRLWVKIDEAFSSLSEAFDEWGTRFINRRFIRTNTEVTWANRTRLRWEVPVRLSTAREVEEKGQYSFQTEDRSLVCIYYSFDSRKGTLNAASLAFYAVGLVATSDGLEADEDDGGEGEDEFFADLPEDEDPIIPWMRVDYSKPGGGILHHECHLHVGGFPDGRLAVSAVPSPHQFVDTLVALAYPEWYRAQKLKSASEFVDGSDRQKHRRCCLPTNADEWLDHVAHLSVPSLAPTRFEAKRRDEGAEKKRKSGARKRKTARA